MSLKITILGCGNSLGVPAVGNYWGDCDPNEPKNRRFKYLFERRTHSYFYPVILEANVFESDNLGAVQQYKKKRC